MLNPVMFLVSKDLTGFELPPLPTPKSETEADNSGENKPDLKELLVTLLDYVKEPLEYLKKMIFDEKNVSQKVKTILVITFFY